MMPLNMHIPNLDKDNKEFTLHVLLNREEKLVMEQLEKKFSMSKSRIVRKLMWALHEGKDLKLGI